MKLLILAGALAAAPTNDRLPSDQVYKVVWLEDAAIDVDGQLAEPAWDKAGPLAAFSFPWKKAPPPKTVFRAVCDRQRLYFSFVIDDADIVVLDRLRDEEDAVLEDRAELYFSRDAKMANYFCAEVDSRGRAFDYRGAFYRQIDPTFNLRGLKTAASPRAGGYVVEGSIEHADFEAFGMPRPQPGARLLAGVYRAEFSHDRSGRKAPAAATIHNRGRANDGPPPVEEWISWVDPRTPEADFHLPASLGWLEVAAAGEAVAGAAISEVVAPAATAEVLGEGYGFCEGPAADARGRIYFSDGKKDAIHFYQSGRPVVVFSDKSIDANGMMFDSRGRLVVCEGAAHQVVAYDVASKRKVVLATGVDGLPFNEPNDLTIDRTDGFYFTDPNYRHRGQPSVMKEDTYYVSAAGTVTRVSTVCIKPNGVLLSADDKVLYLADNGGKCLYKYDVLGPGRLANQTKWIDLGAGPDGLTLDERGNLYVACGPAGIKVYRPDGAALGTIEVAYASNCVFGGPDFRTLYITARDKFLGLPMRVAGMRPRVTVQSQ